MIIFLLNSITITWIIFFGIQGKACEQERRLYPEFFIERYQSLKVADWYGVGTLTKSEKPVSDKNGCLPTSWRVSISVDRVVKGDSSIKDANAVIYDSGYSVSPLEAGKTFLIYRTSPGKYSGVEFVPGDSLKAAYLSRLISNDFRQRPLNSIIRILKSIPNEPSKNLKNCFKAKSESDIRSCIMSVDNYEKALSHIMWSESNVSELKKLCSKIPKSAGQEVLETCVINLVYRTSFENRKKSQDLCEHFRSIAKCSVYADSGFRF